MSLYGYLIIGAFIGPLLLSFDKKVAFYKNIKFFILGLLFTATFFLVWDEAFTINKIWGFNPRYLWGIYLGHLPLEEVLFFFIVPYNCVFIHQVLKVYFPDVKLKNWGTRFFVLLGISSLVLTVFYFKNWYTFTTCLITFCCCVYALAMKPSWLGNFAFTYCVCLLPFFIVNGALTGAFTTEPIVWYSEKHIIGWRMTTIPFEDLYYNFSMLFPIIAFFENRKSKSLS